MRRRTLRAGLGCALLLWAAGGNSLSAQPPAEAPPTPALAHATGHAVVTQPANLMLLAFERVFEGEDFASLWPGTTQFRTDMLEGLKDLGDQASLRLVSVVEQSSPPRLVSRGAVAVNFGPLLGQTDGEHALARALDGISALCTRLGATPGAITYELVDETGIRQEAVRLATENAFLPAESVARALRADLFTVDEVTVKSLKIHGAVVAPTASNPTPTGREVACEAEVEVTYLLADRP
jgi:hypothetical protein